METGDGPRWTDAPHAKSLCTNNDIVKKGEAKLDPMARWRQKTQDKKAATLERSTNIASSESEPEEEFEIASVSSLSLEDEPATTGGASTLGKGGDKRPAKHRRGSPEPPFPGGDDEGQPKGPGGDRNILVAQKYLEGMREGNERSSSDEDYSDTTSEGSKHSDARKRVMDLLLGSDVARGRSPKPRVVVPARLLAAAGDQKFNGSPPSSPDSPTARPSQAIPMTRVQPAILAKLSLDSRRPIKGTPPSAPPQAKKARYQMPQATPLSKVTQSLRVEGSGSSRDRRSRSLDSEGVILMQAVLSNSLSKKPAYGLRNLLQGGPSSDMAHTISMNQNIQGLPPSRSLRPRELKNAREMTQTAKPEPPPQGKRRLAGSESTTTDNSDEDGRVAAFPMHDTIEMGGGGRASPNAGAQNVRHAEMFLRDLEARTSARHPASSRRGHVHSPLASTSASRLSGEGHLSGGSTSSASASPTSSRSRTSGTAGHSMSRVSSGIVDPVVIQLLGTTSVRAFLPSSQRPATHASVRAGPSEPTSGRGSPSFRSTVSSPTTLVPPTHGRRGSATHGGIALPAGEAVARAGRRRSTSNPPKPEDVLGSSPPDNRLSMTESIALPFETSSNPASDSPMSPSAMSVATSSVLNSSAPARYRLLEPEREKQRSLSFCGIVDVPAGTYPGSRTSTPTSSQGPAFPASPMATTTPPVPVPPPAATSTSSPAPAIPARKTDRRSTPQGSRTGTPTAQSPPQLSFPVSLGLSATPTHTPTFPADASTGRVSRSTDSFENSALHRSMGSNAGSLRAGLGLSSSLTRSSTLGGSNGSGRMDALGGDLRKPRHRKRSGSRSGKLRRQAASHAAAAAAGGQVPRFGVAGAVFVGSGGSWPGWSSEAEKSTQSARSGSQGSVLTESLPSPAGSCTTGGDLFSRSHTSDNTAINSSLTEATPSVADSLRSKEWDISSDSIAQIVERSGSRPGSGKNTPKRNTPVARSLNVISHRQGTESLARSLRPSPVAAIEAKQRRGRMSYTVSNVVKVTDPRHAVAEADDEEDTTTETEDSSSSASSDDSESEESDDAPTPLVRVKTKRGRGNSTASGDKKMSTLQRNRQLFAATTDSSDRSNERSFPHPDGGSNMEERDRRKPGGDQNIQEAARFLENLLHAGNKNPSDASPDSDTDSAYSYSDSMTNTQEKRAKDVAALVGNTAAEDVLRAARQSLDQVASKPTPTPYSSRVVSTSSPVQSPISSSPPPRTGSLGLPPHISAAVASSPATSSAPEILARHRLPHHSLNKSIETGAVPMGPKVAMLKLSDTPSGNGNSPLTRSDVPISPFSFSAPAGHDLFPLHPSPATSTDSPSDPGAGPPFPPITHAAHPPAPHSNTPLTHSLEGSPRPVTMGTSASRVSPGAPPGRSLDACVSPEPVRRSSPPRTPSLEADAGRRRGSLAPLAPPVPKRRPSVSSSEAPGPGGV